VCVFSFILMLSKSFSMNKVDYNDFGNIMVKSHIELCESRKLFQVGSPNLDNFS